MSTQPEKSIWLLSKNEPMTSSNIGVVIINWDDVSESRCHEILNSLYKDNEAVISGMTYKEYVPELAEKIKQIPAFVEGKLEENKKPKQAKLF